jgi:heme a synthase
VHTNQQRWEILMSMNHTTTTPAAMRQRWLRNWFLALYVTILAMVILGGATRLTGSGLSIVEWRPVTGIVPPLSEGDWQREFAKYQSSPEFRLKNAGMDVAGFRRIFLWEYVHRLVGRLLGFLLLIPALALWALRKGDPWVRRRALGLTLLVAAQGLMGWLMVKSGLVARPEVSHFRLAAHFMLAVSTLLVVAWTWLELGLGRARIRRAGASTIALGAVIAGQLVYGAFLAGTKAGWAYATFPTLNGEWFPSGGWALQPAMENLVANGLFIHWWHRVLGTLLLSLLWWNFARQRGRKEGGVRGAALALACLGTLQYSLGVLTVLLHVPVALGVAHQFVAILLISAWLCWGFLEAQARGETATATPR